jgi:hypothetical protein
MRHANLTVEIPTLVSSATAIGQAVPSASPTLAAMVARAAAAGLKPGGFVDDARRAATPYVVDCKGLSRDNLGAEPFRFEYELQVRRAWCDEKGGLYEIEALRDGETHRVTGFRFRLAGLVEAVFFKLSFDTNL